MDSEVLIGLEVHVQVTSLRTKLFCRCSSNYRGNPPNTNVCPVCLGLPGSLPVLNKKALEKAIAVALALNSRVSDKLVFVRKHYFYPDLPKNYQVSQYDRYGLTPIAIGGSVAVDVDGSSKVVRIRRINIEEDTGRIAYPEKSVLGSRYALVDYNRAGVALLEIVTEPDLRTPREARVFLEKLGSVLEHLEVADTSLEGAMRADANVSVAGGPRVEIKNIGSPKDLEKALNYEIARQLNIVKSGGTVERETRHWIKERGITVASRVKELEGEYRYFPDPDLPPIPIGRELVEAIAKSLPELPDQRARRIAREYGIGDYMASVLVLHKKLCDHFENASRVCGNPKLVSSILINEFLRWVDEAGVDVPSGITRLSTDRLCKLVQYFESGLVSIKLLKEYVRRAVLEDTSPEELLSKGLTTLGEESEIERVVEEVFRENPKAVADAIRDPKAVNFLVGQVMKKTRGRADPKLVNEIIRRRLAEYGVK
ncbi:MAG: Asp-tRNA(Asn)/Glu-tRNA(Gln) amidotransferase subunit GatB [Sulfolobales archaeon]|nr:Asp-tRNA(Asn)/Glu-tRNA(Gln) amidotransferase subunit GatB [Sulfolobales archaeon]MDW8010847.1 Asp-tRNA(Asn)/Glu-tRNA(Gln) amidotransferase subunit GatB [Sulfolobales archaeon]